MVLLFHPSGVSDPLPQGVDMVPGVSGDCEPREEDEKLVYTDYAASKARVGRVCLLVVPFSAAAMDEVFEKTKCKTESSQYEKIELPGGLHWVANLVKLRSSYVVEGVEIRVQKARRGKQNATGVPVRWR